MPKYKVSIDKEKCIGCGACAAACEEVFEMKGIKAHAKEAETFFLVNAYFIFWHFS
jgi:ferredoxin